MNTDKKATNAEQFAQRLKKSDVPDWALHDAPVYKNYRDTFWFLGLGRVS